MAAIIPSSADPATARLYPLNPSLGSCPSRRSTACFYQPFLRGAMLHLIIFQAFLVPRQRFPFVCRVLRPLDFFQRSPIRLHRPLYSVAGCDGESSAGLWLLKFVSEGGRVGDAEGGFHAGTMAVIQEQLTILADEGVNEVGHIQLAHGFASDFLGECLREHLPFLAIEQQRDYLFCWLRRRLGLSPQVKCLLFPLDVLEHVLLLL